MGPRRARRTDRRQPPSPEPAADRGPLLPGPPGQRHTAFAHALADAVDATGRATGVPIFAGSLRSAPDDLFEALGTLDALVLTVLAAGGSVPASASAGGDDEAWDVERIAALDLPVLQGLCLTSSRAECAANDDGVTPLDSASQIAIPEFDGRITAPFSFKEIGADGLPRYVADPERCRRVAEIAVNHARLRHVPNAEKKVALVCSRPTRPSTRGWATRSALDPAHLLEVATRAAGLNQAEVARRGGTSQATVIAYERGLKSPSLKGAARLLGLMGWEFTLQSTIDFEEYHPPGIPAFWVPNLLWRVPTPGCFDTLGMPDLLQYTAPGEWDLADRTDRRHAYEVLIPEGVPRR
ncbi:helix-turn-helix domain-containing protein [Nocardioides pantholopis]|uniref:helix-turn-helix domain-containing protein n=1 Tax=Nocardioides pantholopis TaxID=2483798 RepID=UPI001F14D94C|nr:cobaltochelatase subunit CobN [Nocardioides pantholopis]